MRFVALIGSFALLLGGYGTYITFLRPAPAFDGATDSAHVAAVKALIASLPAVQGTTLDPYGTWCDGAAAACWTSTTEQPKELASALTKLLVARGGKVRSHACVKPEARPIPAPEGGCGATLDYHGSRIDVAASSAGKSDNGGRTFLRVDSLLVTPVGSSLGGSALGPWSAVNPLTVAWTTGVTCVQSARDGCHRYSQSPAQSPVLALTRTQVCAAARASLKGRFFFAFDEDYGDPVATGAAHAYCSILAHRYRGLGAKDGEMVHIVATSLSATSTTVGVTVGADS